MKKYLLGKLEDETPDVLNNIGCQRQGRGMLGLLLMAVLMTWMVPAKAQAQTNFSGVYYFSGNNQGQNSYNVNNTTTNYYLCPTEDWIYYQATDNFTTTNNGQPFLTTYQYRNGSEDSTKAVWIIKKHPSENYYYIIHAKDGKYVTYNGPMPGTSSNGTYRIRVHLEETNSPDDNMLFDITQPSPYYDISPKNKNGWFLNITQGNQNSLQGTEAKQDGPSYTLNGVTTRNVGGTIGLWNQGGDYTSKWYREDARGALTPTISEINVLNQVTITWPFVPPTCLMVYTTDGTEPAYNNDGTIPENVYVYTGTTPLSITVTQPNTTIKAAVLGYGMVLSNIPSKTVSPFVLDAPSFAVNCQNQLAMRCNNLPDAHIYYTTATGGDTPAEPTNSNGTLYDYENPLQLDPGTKVRARAYNLMESLYSDVFPSTGYYTFQPAYSVPPTITFTSATNVAISYSTAATIYYNITEDGSEPATPSTTAYTGTGTANTTLNVTIDPTKVIRISAIAKEGSLAPSCDPATGWKLPQPELATSCDDATLTITSSFPVYYTTAPDLGTPTTESIPYTEPITGLTVGDRLNILAIDSQNHTSYLIEYTHVATHTAAPTIAMTNNSTTITITGPAGSTIHYTTNGYDPVIGALGVTSGDSPLTISYSGGVMDIRALAKVSSLEPSCVTQFMTLALPTVSFSENGCTERNILTITNPNASGTLWYAITSGNASAAPDVNATPNPYSSYTAPVVLDDLDGNNEYYTIHAYAQSSDGSFNSAVVSVSRQMITAGKPFLTPPSGSSPVLGISGGVYRDVAVCTIDMGTPSDDDDDVVETVRIASDGTAQYGIPNNAVGTLSVAFKHIEWQPSCDSTYTIPQAPEAPTAVMSCDNKLSLINNSPMAVIHYEIGIGDAVPSPTLSSYTYTDGCLDTISAGTRVRAKAFKDFLSSAELDTTYQPIHVAVPQFFVDGTTVTMTSASGSTIYYTMSVGTQAGVVPADPLDPNASGVTPNEYTGPITIAQGNIITVFKAIAIPADPDQEASCVVRVVTREGYSISNPSDLDKLNAHPESYFFVLNDIDAGSYPATTVNKFTGVLDGNYYTISNLNKPLFDTITSSDNVHNAAVFNLMLKDVTVEHNSGSGNAGAIANTALGYTRIFNCGILSSDTICDADGSIIGFSGSSVTGTANVGGIVGELDGTARVINCFSYANINGGTDRGGIVGNNKYASTSSDLKTMVMNCMFYGDISVDGNPTISPVYGGSNISNAYSSSSNTGLNNYCFFYYNGEYVNHIANDNFHGSLGSEERFLNRFEFFRLTLNSNRSLAAYYVDGTHNKDLMAKWVLDKSIAPFPILKAPGYYPSLVNYDAEHAVPIDPDTVHYNEGRKLGTLTVKIRMGAGGAHFEPPVEAEIYDAVGGVATKTLNIIDKDTANFNFNYKKIQLPYYNQVGSNNYVKASDETGRVVTGWKIVEISPAGTGHFTTNASNNNTGIGKDFPDWNFVDRSCTEKDLYSVTGRVFSQGAYWEVPDGVTSITIEPYWAKAVYLSDANYDVTYDGTTKYKVTVVGTCPTTVFDGQTVYNSINNVVSNDVVTTHGAIEALEIEANYTVYDYAVVLVGNYHQCATQTLYNTSENKPVTFMSADLDDDCEPDNSLFYYHAARKRVGPIRFDFLNMPGVGMVKRTWNSKFKPEPGIFKPAGWFEITNTVVVRFGQFEYADGNTDWKKLHNAPLILHGGVYEQFVSAHSGNIPVDKTNYILIGGNSWFKNFANGCHTANPRQTPKVPISVVGGDYENFYLTGIYQASINPTDENVVCYIDGGRFSEVAGAGMQRVDGNATWVINAADMKSFFGGGINPAQSITGHITTTISNSRVNEFYGGPKFGVMSEGKLVKTTATNCRFDKFYGAGYGGTSYNRVGCEDVSAEIDTPPWGTYVNDHYTRGYETTHHSNNGSGSDIEVKAISTSYEYEYILHSDGTQTVARFFVNFATLSFAKTKNVITELTGCTIDSCFYGGGRLGAVDGDITSTLTDCVVKGDVFGSGFSAEKPTISVMNKANFVTPPAYKRRAGVFNDRYVEFPPSIEYIWEKDPTYFTEDSAYLNTTEDGKHYIKALIEEDFDELGSVKGNVTLTINGNSVVKGDVYGGGALSKSNINDARIDTIRVNINGGTYGVAGAATGGNIYGGGMGNGNYPVTEDCVMVSIGNSSQTANNVVINGSVYGCNNYNGTPTNNVFVDVWATKHDENNGVSSGTGYAIANVFGGGHLADYSANGKKATVRIHGCENTIGRVFGGGDAAAAPGVVSVIDGGRFNWVFGGGNGEVTAADIGAGGININVHGGTINELFGGSNTSGTILGPMSVNVDNSSGCGEDIDEFFGGCNMVDIGTAENPIDLNTTIGCGTIFSAVYGGSNKANIYGNVSLTVTGGVMDYAYGGSKGVAVGDATYPDGISADISGDVSLTLTGGTIGQAFGGSNVLGSIGGNITVNVEDAEDPDCPLVLTDVFGGGNLAVYGGTPEVNVKNGTVLGNVYGGGNGDPTDDTQAKGSTGAPTVTIGDLSAGHENYVAKVVGDVYGGGNAAKVTGTNVTTSVNVLNKCNTEIGYVYGGGNMASVPATNVTIEGGTIHNDVYGGGHGDNDPEHNVAANVTGGTSVYVTGAKIDRVFAGSNRNGAIGGDMLLTIDKSGDANCNMIIHEVYGGGNYAAGKAATITLGCTGNIVDGENGHIAHPENIGTTLEGIGTLYGGANRAAISDDNDIVLNINKSIINKVFGGNNTSGEIAGKITVNIEQNDQSCGWYVGEVYGGGDHAYYDSIPDVNIIAGTVYRNVYGGGNDITTPGKGVKGSAVEMSGGQVLGNVYGGCNLNGVVETSSNVSITSGIVGSESQLTDSIISQVFGGGYGENTKVKGNVTVTIDSVGNNVPVIWGDVYGGSALGEVNTDDDGAATSTKTTTVNIYNGTLKTKPNVTLNDFPVYPGGNVFGGGLGRKAVTSTGVTAAEAKVYGKVTVNIGKGRATSPTTAPANVDGHPVIEGNIYGCNNTNGSPQQDVTVNIFQTAHTPNDSANYEGSDRAYALHNVFGGGNEADFTVEGKRAFVNIYGCDNTVRRTFGGGNAAATNEVFTMIQGGRFAEVFSGGNGEVRPADVHGNVNLTIHGGDVGQTYGGSNQHGTIDGQTFLTIDDQGPCGTVNIEEHFCGGKYADFVGNINAVIRCSDGMFVNNLYGGCKEAHVVDWPVGHENHGQGGNVHLTVYGGTYQNVYGGSKGTPDVGADILGNVQLDVLGGTVSNAIFGGSNVKGAIGGTIIVNVQDSITTDACPLDVSIADVYGGGNQADYPGVPQEGGPLYGSTLTHTAPYNYPQINIKNATVKNVFGGGLEAKVIGNPQIKLKKGAKVLGNVYGGGNMGEVDGNPKVTIDGKDNTRNPAPLSPQ